MIIYHDLVGLILGMQGWFNTYKSIKVIYHINKTKGWNHVIIFPDVEKAFDKIKYLLIIKKKKTLFTDLV